MTNLTKFNAQATLNQCHADAMECVQMYASGLVTLPELANHLMVIKRVYMSVIDTDGIFDPATGLSYGDITGDAKRGLSVDALFSLPTPQGA